MYQHKASYTLVWLISFTLFHISDLNNVTCLKNNMFVACATGKTKTLVKTLVCLQNSAKILVAPVYQDLSMCRDWSVEKDIDDLPIRLKGNAKHTSRNFIESIEGPEQ